MESITAEISEEDLESEEYGDQSEHESNEAELAEIVEDYEPE